MVHEVQGIIQPLLGLEGLHVRVQAVHELGVLDFGVRPAKPRNAWSGDTRRGLSALAFEFRPCSGVKRWPGPEVVEKLIHGLCAFAALVLPAERSF